MKMKKKLSRILLVCVLSLAMCLGMSGALSAGVSSAAEKYTYTVRIFAGQQGTVGGGEVKVYEGLSYNDRVTFNLRDVSISDGNKYYVRGLRESGRDNNTVMENASFTVTGDRDYVVAYGLLNDAVAYTIHYEDAEGNTLAPSETYYGNVGDKPVIAYLYIEGYLPQAYNLAKTLVANAEENVFTFIYTPIEEGTEPVQPTEPEDEETTAAEEPGGEEPGGEEPGGEEPGGEEPGGGEVDIPDPDVPLEGPTELQDLDIQDSEVPLANVDQQPQSSVMSLLYGNALLMRIPTPVKVCVLIILIGGIILITRKLMKNKKEKQV